MQDSTISGILLVALFVCFIAVVYWAWSSKRHTAFDAASRLPLEDDIEVIESLNNKDQQGQNE